MARLPDEGDLPTRCEGIGDGNGSDDAVGTEPWGLSRASESFIRTLCSVYPYQSINPGFALQHHSPSNSVSKIFVLCKRFAEFLNFKNFKNFIRATDRILGSTRFFGLFIFPLRAVGC